MALGRRGFLGALPLCVAAVAACSRAGAPGARTQQIGYEELFQIARPKGKGKILVLMPATPQTREVWTGLSDELGREYSLVAVRVDSRADVDVVAQGIARHAPSALVLMNNPTVGAYADYQRQKPGGKFPPAVVVMTSFLDQQQSLLHATGIHYEVPLITVVTNLRKLMAKPIERIGVVRRAQLSVFVEKQAKLARREGIFVEEEEVSGSPNASELKRALRRVRQRSEALWVLNDDKLLTPRLIADGWLPGVSERPWIPTIVGAGSLVAPTQSFGTFAVLPDHTALGTQAAAMVFDLAESEWTLSEGARAQLPLSTTTTVDLVQTKERFMLREGALTQVDRILQ